MNTSNPLPAALVAGNERFWTIQEAVHWLQENASLRSEDAENIAGQALNAARRGLLTTRHHPTGAARAGQRTAGIAGAAWHFYAKDFNAWLDAANLTSHRLPEASPVALRQVSKAPAPITPVARGSSLGAMSLPGTLTGMASTLKRMEADQPRARWNLWKHRKHLELWQGVCLTMDVEPTDAILKAHRWPIWLHDRLDFLIPFLLDSDTFGQTMDDGGGSLHVLVSMREFALLAVKLWPDSVPQELRALAESKVQPAVKPQNAAIPNPIDPASSKPEGTKVPERKRMDDFATLLHQEQKKCFNEGANPMELAEMWPRFIALAQQTPKPPHPLKGYAEGDIKWERDGDTQTMNKAAFSKRLKASKGG